MCSLLLVYLLVFFKESLEITSGCLVHLPKHLIRYMLRRYLEPCHKLHDLAEELGLVKDNIVPDRASQLKPRIVMLFLQFFDLKKQRIEVIAKDPLFAAHAL